MFGTWSCSCVLVFITNINYNAVDGVVDNCGIYIGYEGCHVNSATKVGNFTITPTTVTYSLEKGVYEANEFHFYAGKCRANDGASSLTNGGFCDNGQICIYADDVGSYNLVSDSNPKTDLFTFDSTFQPTGMWPNYQTVPIGSTNRTFLSAHANVCIVPGAGTTSRPVFTPGQSAQSQLLLQTYR
jgi:hypothetical protein